MGQLHFKCFYQETFFSFACKKYVLPSHTISLFLLLPPVSQCISDWKKRFYNCRQYYIRLMAHSYHWIRNFLMWISTLSQTKHFDRTIEFHLFQKDSTLKIKLFINFHLSIPLVLKLNQILTVCHPIHLSATSSM